LWAFGPNNPGSTIKCIWPVPCSYTELVLELVALGEAYTGGVIRAAVAEIRTTAA